MSQSAALPRRILNVAAQPVRHPLLRSAMVESRIRFFMNDLVSRRGVHAYTLENSGATVLLRHDNALDTFVLEEVFGRIDAYRVPQHVARTLNAVGVRKIVDLGGNIGLAALKFLLQFPDAELVAFEPDAENAAILEATLERNHLRERSQVVRAAAGVAHGSVRFVTGLAGHSHAAAPGERGVDVPMIDILPELVDADLLKMDIEGGEWPILADHRFRELGVQAICMEYHARHCPERNPRDMAMALLRRAGFEIAELTDEGGTGLVWAQRP